MRQFIACSAPLNLYAKSEKGNARDIGDVCIYLKRSTPPPGVVLTEGASFCGSLYFTRNNVLVRILNNCEEGKKYIDIIKLAKLIDNKLLDMLE